MRRDLYFNTACRVARKIIKKHILRQVCGGFENYTLQ
jgi:hypothetical protein